MRAIPFLFFSFYNSLNKKNKIKQTKNLNVNNQHRVYTLLY